MPPSKAMNCLVALFSSIPSRPYFWGQEQSFFRAIGGQLWHYLKNRRSMVDKLWLILGDFNEVLLPSKTRDSRVFIQSRVAEFAKVVDKCQLMDLGAYGGKYTWSRSS